MFKELLFNLGSPDNSCLVCKEIRNIFKASNWELGQLLSWTATEMILQWRDWNSLEEGTNPVVLSRKCGPEIRGVSLK